MAKLALIKTRPHPSGSFIPYQAISVNPCTFLLLDLYRHSNSSFSTVKEKKAYLLRSLVQVLLSSTITTAIVSLLASKKKKRSIVNRFSSSLIKFVRTDRSHIFVCVNAPLTRRLNREFNDSLSWFRRSVVLLHWSTQFSKRYLLYIFNVQ